MWPEVRRHLHFLEREVRRSFADPTRPLLVSVRSGARKSMPGMLDTLLNVEIPDSARGSLAGLQLAIEQVIDSWSGERARAYRRWAGIGDSGGTAVIVQAMVLGNRGGDSGVGVATVAKGCVRGEWLQGEQGDVLMTGAASPASLGELALSLPATHRELSRMSRRLEEELGEAVEVEFTVEEGRLFLLQVRAVEAEADPRPPLVEEGSRGGEGVLLSGVPASPGIASGTATASLGDSGEGGPVVLVRESTAPADVPAMLESVAVVTARGGFTSHAAVICREAGIPCVVGCGAGALALLDRQVTVNGSTGDIAGGRA